MNMTENLSESIFFFGIYVFGIILTIAITVVVIRWVFRINVIVDLLQKIAASHKCHSCDRFFRVDELEKSNLASFSVPIACQR
jgi:hypothetical protein